MTATTPSEPQPSTPLRTFRFVIWDGSEDEGEEQSEVEVQAATPEEARELALDEFLDNVRVIEAHELSEEDGMVSIPYDDESLRWQAQKRLIEYTQQLRRAARTYLSHNSETNRNYTPTRASFEQLRDLVESEEGRQLAPIPGPDE